MTTPPDGLFPVTPETMHASFDWVFAPWIKEMGFTDFEVRAGDHGCYRHCRFDSRRHDAAAGQRHSVSARSLSAPGHK